MPQSVACPPRYNYHTYRVDWQSRTLHLSTTSGRQTIRFKLQDYAAKYSGCEVDTADLLERDGDWWLHVVMSVPAPEVETTDEVVGIDLGIKRPAVTSNNRFLGAKRWKAVEGRYFKQVQALQKKGSGFDLNADLNGARNIAAKYRARCASDASGGLCNQPVVSSPACRVEAQAVRL